MKTYKNIYPHIYAYENLFEAWRKAARGKRRSPAVATFEYALTDNLLQLADDLTAQTYRPGPYRHFRLRVPKPRRISAAPFRDRVVHHALVRQIEPIHGDGSASRTSTLPVKLSLHGAQPGKKDSAVRSRSQQLL